MKKFTDAEKTDLTNAAQTAGANPAFDAFWADVEAELRRLNPELTITPKKTT